MATIVNAKFKQKRGTEASIPVLLEGELYVCTDNNKLYVGSASGHQLISDISQLNALTNNKQDKLTESGWIEVEMEGTAIKAYSGSALKYNKRDKLIELNGEIKGLRNINSNSEEVTIGTLPTGFRPPRTCKITCRSSGLNTCQLSINATGELKLSKFADINGLANSMTGEEVIQISGHFMVL